MPPLISRRQRPQKIRTPRLVLAAALGSTFFSSSAPAQALRVACIGDYGWDGPDEQAVASMVDGWSPDAVITLGDNAYDDIPIDESVGKYFAHYIGNYNGDYGPGETWNRFFPSLGNHDYSDGGVDAYLEYFTLPGEGILSTSTSGTETYYDVMLGPVHFFALDSNFEQSDGISPASVQGRWLQERLAASTATWNVVYFHHCPYSSGNHGNEVHMQWPFAEWGADAVLSGHDHDYERLSVDGLAYFVNGAGGKNLRPFPGEPLPETVVRYDEDHGALLITADEAALTFEFWSVTDGGTLIDSHTIENPTAPALAVHPPALDFDATRLEGAAWEQVEIRNVGVLDLHVTDLAIAGANAADFEVYAPPLPFTVPPQSAMYGAVRFSPTSVGPRSGALVVTSDDPLQGPVEVALGGPGIHAPPGGPIEFEESATGGATLSRSVTSGPLSGVETDLYLAAISSKGFTPVAGVDGLGAAWSLLRSQCGGRSQTGVEVWIGQDATGDGSVTATFDGSPDASAIVVTRYSGGNFTDRLGTAESKNTNGLEGSCSGGDDGSTYSLEVPTTAPNSVVYGAVAMRHRLLSPGVGWEERDEARAGSGGSVASVATIDLMAESPDLVLLEGSFSGAADWSVVGVEIRGGAGDAPDIFVSPATFDFGVREAGTVATTTVRIRNDGTEDLVGEMELIDASPASAFSLPPGGGAFTLVPGETRDVEIRFAPDSEGPENVTLRITSNDWDEGLIDVALFGEGHVPAPDVMLAPASFDFGDVEVAASGSLRRTSGRLEGSFLRSGETSSAVFTLGNDGDADLHVSAITLVGAEAPDFALVAEGGSFTLIPGETRTLGVSFVPGSLGEKTAELRVESDDPDEGVVAAGLRGNGVEPTFPDIAVAPASLDFGVVWTGLRSELPVEVRNDGDDLLTVAETSVSGVNAGDFSLVGGDSPFTLEPGAARSLTAVFAPAAPGWSTASVRVVSDDPDEGVTEVALAGTGVLPPPPAEITFLESVTGGSTGSSVASDPLPASLTDELYLAALSTKSHVSVESVEGLGLAWTLVREQCGGRSQTGTSVFMAHGPSAGGTVTATFGSTPDAAVIAVARYAGADPLDPVGNVASANTNGPDGDCSGGSDESTYALDFSTSAEGAVVFGAVATRHRLHASRDGSTEQVSSSEGSGGSTAGITLFDRAVATASDLVVEGEFSGSVDWSLVVLEILPRTGESPAITVAPEAHDFGEVPAGDTVSYGFLVVNSGTGALTVDGLELVGSAAAEFAFDSGAAPFTLGSGESRSLAVTFTPAGPGPKSATLRVTSNVPERSPFDVALSGTGVAAPAPQLVIVPDAHDWGSVVVGESVSHAFEVRNDGDAATDVVATDIVGADSASFSVESGSAPFTLDPGATHEIVIAFTPTAIGSAAAALNVGDHEGGAIQGLLAGTGIAPPEPDIVIAPLAHDFGDVIVGETASRSFEIRNAGDDDLEVSGTEIVGGDGSFSLSGGAPFALAPGESRDVAVVFSPSNLGPAASSLRVTAADPDEPVTDLALGGAGVAPPEATEVTFTATATGGSTGRDTVESSPLPASGGQDLYLAAVSSKNHDTVERVDGLGLAWTLVRAQCGARSQTGMTVFMAQGPSPGGSVTATFVDTPDVASIVVVRYAGTDPAGPVGNVVSANTDGVDGGCSGGTDRDSYSVELATTEPGALAFAAIALRHRNHLPGDDWEERETVVTGSGGTSAGIAVEDRLVAFPGTALVDGEFDSTVDWAVVALEIRPAPAESPAISVAPVFHDWGDVVAGEGVPYTFLVANSGSAVLRVGDVTIQGTGAAEFTIDAGGDPFTLQPGETRDVVVSFAPASVGAASAVLRLTSDDPNRSPLDVPLTGTGVAVPEPDIAVSPDSHDYGSVTVGATLSHPVEIRNEGSAPLAVTATGLEGPESASFAIDAGAAPFTLEPGETRELVVRFSPTASGPAAASLSVTSDDPDEATVRVALAGTGVAAPVPDITVSPAAHDFGEVLLGDASVQPFEIRNDGTATLTVETTELVGADASAFSVESGGAPFALEPGGSREVVVRFSAEVLGDAGATLRVTSDDPDESAIDVRLTGTGVPLPVPDVAVTPESADFGDVRLGETASQGFRIGNDGTANLNVGATDLVGSGAGAWEIVEGGAPFVLTPGEVRDLSVSFTPGERGENAVTLRVTSDDPDEATVDVRITGNGVAPDVAVTPPSHDFGDLLPGATASQTFRIENAGTADLLVSAASIVGAGAATFTMDDPGVPFSLRPGAFVDVSIAFSPDALGAVSAALRIESDDPENGIVDVSLAGTGVQPDITVAPASHDFGDVRLGGAGSHAFSIANDGTSPLSVEAIALTGPDATYFEIESGEAPFTLAAAETADVVVRFVPTETGPASAVLEVVSDDPDESPFALTLAGTGVVPDVTVGTLAHEWGSVLLGDVVSRDVEVRNDGTASLTVSSTEITGPQAASFAIESGAAPFTLVPGEVGVVTLLFAPQQLGPASAVLRLSCDDPDEATVDVSLSGSAFDYAVDEISLQETGSGGANSAIGVGTSSDLSAVPGDLYLAAVSTKRREPVLSMSGLGLSWTRVLTQCSAGDQTGIEIWVGQGTPTSDGRVTAEFGSKPNSAAIVVSRYSGIDGVAPLGPDMSGNTNGVSGGCDGGPETSSYSFSFTTSTDGAVVFAAASMRNRTHSPGAGWAERAELREGNGGDATSVAIMDRLVPEPEIVSVEGTFDGTVEWAVAALELRPATIILTASARNDGRIAADLPAARPPAAATDRASGGPLPASFRISTSRPNPFRGETALEYALPAPTDVEITIYDAAGRAVRRLARGVEPAGLRTIRWNGRNDAGARVGSGVYFLRFRAGPETHLRKLILSR